LGVRVEHLLKQFTESSILRSSCSFLQSCVLAKGTLMLKSAKGILMLKSTKVWWVERNKCYSKCERKVLTTIPLTCIYSFLHKSVIRVGLIKAQFPLLNLITDLFTTITKLLIYSFYHLVLPPRQRCYANDITRYWEEIAWRSSNQ